MKLKDFIAGALKEVIDGIADAQSYYAQKGGAVNAKGLTFTVDKSTHMWDEKTGQPAPLVEFDVTVTTFEEAAGVFVASASQGMQEASQGSRETGRIKFYVPVSFPSAEPPT